MHPQIKGSNRPTSISEIAALADKFGLTFPESYIAFLLQYNGGRPEPSCFSIFDMPLNSFGSIQVFFGVKASAESSDIESVLNEFPESVPSGILPIASNGCGDFICLDLRREQALVVFFDYHEFWGNNIWKESLLYRVADSFSEFINCLFAFPVDRL